MARNFNITSANAKVTMISAFTPAGLNFENFSVDNAWTQDLIQQIEARMGVDGKISYGYTPSPKPISFYLQPNSPTVTTLNYFIQAQDTQQNVIVVQMIIEIPALGFTFALQNGACVTNKLLPNAGRVLDPIQYDFVFESINAAPI